MDETGDIAVAWDRKTGLEKEEWRLRTRAPGQGILNDTVTAQWLESSKRDFSAAWAHASAIGADIRRTYAEMLTSPHSPQVIKKVLSALTLDVLALLATMRSHEGPNPMADAVGAIEGVLVACMGHYSALPRASSIRLLNVLYDGVDWQLAGAHETAIRFEQDPFVVEVFTPAAAVPDASRLRILVCGPPYERAASSRVDHILTMHVPDECTVADAWLPAPMIEPSTGAGGSSSEADGGGGATPPPPRFERTSVLRVMVTLAPFSRCGFYDWRVVFVSDDGAAHPVPLISRASAQELASLAAAGVLPAAASVTPAAGDAESAALSQASAQELAALAAAGVPPAAASVTPEAGNAASAAPTFDLAAAPASPSALVFAHVDVRAVAQGRFIVHRADALAEHMHEVIVDLEGMRFTDAGELVKHGSFRDVAASVGALKAKGVTSLYVMGAIERDNGWGDVDTESADPAVRDALDLAVRHGLVLPPTTARLPGADPAAEHAQLQRLLAGQYTAVASPKAASVGESAASDFGFIDTDEPRSGTQHAPAFVLQAGAAGVTFTTSLAIAATPAAAQPLLPPGDDDEGAATGGDGAGFRAFATRPDANPHTVVDRITPNRMLGGPLGLFHLVKESRRLGVRVLVQLDASVSASRPHRKYSGLYARTLDTKGQSAVHHGTDALENQWEDQQLLNYRKLETWNLLVSEAKTLVYNFGLGGLYLSDAQAYPFVMAPDTGELFRRDPDGEAHYSASEVLEGEVVVANSELGFWSTRLARTYPNPLLVKLSRALWQVDPSFSVVGECHWARSGALMRSGVIPHTLDLVGALAANINRFVDKNGRISSFTPPPGAQPVHYLRGMLLGERAGAVPVQGSPQFVSQKLSRGEYPPPLQHMLQGPGGALPAGGQQLLLRSLSSSRLPYPALLLGRNAWTAVDLLYTLPGVPMTFGDERTGKAYRVDVTGTYAHNTTYLDNERKKREQRFAGQKRVQRVRTPAGHAGGAALVPLPAAGNAAALPPLPPSSSSSGRSSQQQLSSDNSKAPPQSNPARPSDAQVIGEMFAYMGLTQQQQSPQPPPLPPASAAPPSTGDLTPDVYDGHVGVGGVVPAGPPRGVPAWKISRGGFSVADGMDSLVASASAQQEHAALHHSQQPDANVATAPPQARAVAAAGRPPLPQGSLARPTGFAGLPRLGDRNYSGSSPALQALLIEAQADVAGNDASPLHYASSHSVSIAGSLAALPAAGGLPLGSDEEEEGDEDEGLDVTTPLSFAGHAAAAGKAAVPAKQRRGLAALPLAAASSDAGAVVAVADVSGVTAESIARVQSWLAMDTMTFKGDVANSTGGDLRDGLRHMTAEEGRLRREVGPEFGFDLYMIQGHYDHRQALRALYPVLRSGDFTVLTAKHRFGEHGHVLAFARSLPGHVCVVATNFNAFASTFAVNATPLVSAFRAATTVSASASVAQLMASSSAAGRILHARIAGGGGADSGRAPSMNLLGGVWEVRDVFASSSLHSPAFAAQHFDESHGPLIGIMTSEEAVYAPMLTTLQPHKSYAWMCVETRAADVRSETDAAAMRWLFASSLLRLQSVLRLKEAGLTSAIITRKDIQDAAGSVDAVIAARTAAGGIKESWISPGEALNDNEIMQHVRHNLVFSLLRSVVDRCHRACATGAAPLEALEETAELMDAALRVLVTHWALRADAPAALPQGVQPPHLKAPPLPSLHGAMNRGSVSAAGGVSTDGAASPGGADSSWYCVDGEVAAVMTRAALFLAVKDVVAQHAGAVAVSADVSDADARLSAMIVKALRWVAAGRTTSGAALRTDPSSSSAEDRELLLRERSITALARRVLWTNTVSPIVFATPELGKWSTVGGLGVMVDELSVGLAELGADVVCISPYYNVDRKGNRDYLARDGIAYAGRNVEVWVNGERIVMGVHEGRVNHVRVFFLHNESVFPRPYPALDAAAQMRVLAAFGQGCLELLVQWGISPSVVVTNDWFTALVPAYARHGRLAGAFNSTDFMHICHNLDPDYEGRLYPTRAQGSLQYMHNLPPNLLVDPHWHDLVINPTRAVLLCTDTWSTVSRSYRTDLLNSSPLRGLLGLTPQPFAQLNGIPVKARLARIMRLPTPTHEAAKEALQRKYFRFHGADPSIPLFAFVGRITLQKGVHLILQAVEELLRATHGRIMFLIGGMASSSDTYGRGCGDVMRRLARDHSDRFWADPDQFFTDGDLVNLGADFCMMPSMFEPGGIVQQEFFVAGTPVIAYKTGGLKDTIVEFDPVTDPLIGNGFHFEAYTVHDFIVACHRAHAVFRDADSYAQLRRNARASVMDLAVVSLGWYREFFRMRRALPPAPQASIVSQGVVVTLPVEGADGRVTPASHVVVRCSATSWRVDTPAQFVPGPDRFEATLVVDPGQYQYGFWVDGKAWLLSPSSPQVPDGSGNLNNLLEVHATEDLDDVKY